MHVEYFFDPVCPFCWVTSRWVVDIAPERDLEIDWRFISLRIINHDTYSRLGPEYEASHGKGRELLRVAAAVKQDHGSSIVGGLYTTMGSAIWEAQPTAGANHRTHIASLDDAVVRTMLASLGLAESYADAMTDESLDSVLENDSSAALERAGHDVGTPIITYGSDGPSFFGPVISTVPPHDVGLRLWDALVEIVQVGTFAELKRSSRAPLDLPILRS